MQANLKFYVITIFLVLMHTRVSYSQGNRLPQELIDLMASRRMRYHHLIWHNVRNQWTNLDERSKSQIRKLGWEPPRPSQRYDEEGRTIRLEDNGSGEDFFYMHREMINQANEILKKYGTKVEGFKTIPAPSDRNYPVPPAFEIPGSSNNNRNGLIKSWKADDFYWEKIKPAEDLYTDPDYLRSVTLAELGSQIEYRIHAWMHLRFASEIAESRPSTSETMPYIDPKWDDPKYSWLVDIYSSHVHPWFWKIHGWVDDRIEDWRRANNIATIKWNGTWTGGPMSGLSSLLNEDEDGYISSPNNNTSKNNNDNSNRSLQDHSHHSMGSMDSMHSMDSMDSMDSGTDVLEEVYKILAKAGGCFYYGCYYSEDD